MHGNASVNGSLGIAETSSQISAKRRTERLELKDKQWDELFEKKNSKSPSRNKTSKKAPPAEMDVRNAQSIAKAKLAANPPHRNSHQKRKRSAQVKEEIFRSKNKQGGCSPTDAACGGGPNSFSRYWKDPSLALCFATPIRGTVDEDDTDLKSEAPSEAGTLNTCEDTIASTVCFENKYSHVVETRPPMPLFNQFKIGDDKDEISSIMASDSHSSVNMIKLLQKQQQQPNQSRRHRPKMDNDVEMEDMPEVKAVSSSTDSSGDSRKAVMRV